MGERLRRAGRYAANPRWGLAYWRSRKARVAGSREREFRADEHPELVNADSAGAIASLTGAPVASCEAALSGASLVPGVADDPSPWWPRESLARLLGALVELTAPTNVVEVGVARGYSSATILAALAAAGGEGRLHSIDLPPLDEDAATFVGAAVPETLRDRWSLRLGPSASELPALLEAVGSVDLFVHDGDHSYASQRADLETAWPHLAPGAIAVVDDVWSTAAVDFALGADAPIVVVMPEGETDGVALLRKHS